MILNSNNWRYNHKGFEAYFLPIGKNCPYDGQQISWNGLKLVYFKNFLFFSYYEY